MMMNKNVFKICLIFSVLFNFSYLSAEQLKTQKSLTETLRAYWPHKAFLAIPRISSLKPRLGLKISMNGEVLGGIRCIEIDELEQKRLFKPKTKMDREEIYRAACDSMLLAIKAVKVLPISADLGPSEEIVLQFDFSQGVVSSTKSRINPVIIEPMEQEES